MAAAEMKLLRRLGWTGEGLITRVTGQRLHEQSPSERFAPVLRRPARGGMPAMTAAKAREGSRSR